MSVNQCNFIGNLGREVDTRFMQNGDPVASFSIACNEKWKGKDGQMQEYTEWVNVTAFGNLAKICGDWLHKGSLVFISGKMKTDTYEKDGVKHYRTSIIAREMKMLGGKHDSQPQQQTQKPQSHSFDGSSTGDDVGNSQVPF